MKFSRYLQDTQVPEWKKAYIDYLGLKKHISTVNKQQESDDRRYRSSLYLGPPTPTHVLWFPVKGRLSREDMFRSSARYSVTFPPRMREVHTNNKTTEIDHHFFNPSITMSSQSKTLSLPMQETHPKLNGVGVEFLAKLDAQLEKVDNFYLEREKEVKDMLTELKRQLVELRDHRKHFQQSKVEDRRLHFPLSFITSPTPSETPRTSPITTDGRFGAVEFRRANKDLRTAVLEHYKKLDALQNFRTLNLIGFQKVLKKWEKVTHMPIRDAYLREKIEPSGFSSTKLLAELIRDTEDMYAVHFARGDKKRARGCLRAGWEQKTHYFAMFRSGLYLGLAIPALAKGLYQSFQPSTRNAIPEWGALLLVYATIFVPVLFSLLVAINILVWTKVRINHAFIFGLNVKSKIGYQQYAEIPAILLSTLCYSFWLSFSFSKIGVKPTTWPLVWLLFNTLILCNPLPMHYRSSRMWLIKRFAKLIISGWERVEFSEFWLGDQICSLNFSLTNLIFIGCVYTSGFKPDSSQRCGSHEQYRAYIVMAVLPFFCRFNQSVRRWYDCRSTTHLINAGKYTTGMLMYAFYYYWRSTGDFKGPGFVFYILAATIYSGYACIWDYLTDWSVLKVHAKYLLLRDEVLCAEALPLYYFAIISNTVIRFSWIMYLSPQGPPVEVKTFIVAMLEMLRRWQWNFLRLENEHLGNIDQYRVTRDVPLPYIFDSSVNDSDSDDWDQQSSRGWWTGRIFTS